MVAEVDITLFIMAPIFLKYSQIFDNARSSNCSLESSDSFNWSTTLTLYLASEIPYAPIK